VLITSRNEERSGSSGQSEPLQAGVISQVGATAAPRLWRGRRAWAPTRDAAAPERQAGRRASSSQQGRPIAPSGDHQSVPPPMPKAVRPPSSLGIRAEANDNPALGWSA